MTWFIEAFASTFKALFSDLGRLLGGTGTQAPIEWSEVDDKLHDELDEESRREAERWARSGYSGAADETEPYVPIGARSEESPGIRV